MLDSHLYKAVRDETWSLAAEQLYALWSEKCPLLYNFTGNAWEYTVDEDAINKELIGPLASMFTLKEQSVDAKQCTSLKPLIEEIGIQDTLRKPGQMCGKMFRNGDPTYTCKECAVDETCVLCHDCFKQSPHAKHRYKMHSSFGSGYCDCGDAQAWSKDFACKLHTAEPQPGDDELNFSVALSPEIRSRVYNITGIVLKYAITLICWQDSEALPEFLSEPSSSEFSNIYKTMLFNDETHTYDAVISALELAISCSSQQAMQLATIVDREGRAVVLSNFQSLCTKAKESIQHRTRKDVNRKTERSGPLEVKVMTASVVAHQALAVKLLSWLTQQSQQFSAIAAIVADVIMKECSVLCRLPGDAFKVAIPPPKPHRSMSDNGTHQDAPEVMMAHPAMNIFAEILQGAADNDMPLVQAIIRAQDVEDEDIIINPIRILQEEAGRANSGQKMYNVPPIERRFPKLVNNSLSCGHLSNCGQLVLFDRRLWKAARVNFHQLFMATVLMDAEHKLNYGRFFIRNYEFIYQDYIDDDHEYAVSVVALGVQLFTVASVARHLVEHENALAIIFETIRVQCYQYLHYIDSQPIQPRFDFTPNSMPAVLRRSLAMFKDAIYLLCQFIGPNMVWTDKLRQSYVNACEVYFELCHYMQGMDAVKRQTDQHQLVESEWETALNIIVQSQEATTLLIMGAKTDSYVHQRLTKLVLDRILDEASLSSEFSEDQMTESKIDGVRVDLISFNVSKDYVSVHQPLWRILGGLLVAPQNILDHYSFESKKKNEVHTLSVDAELDVLLEAGWSEYKPIDKLLIWPVPIMMEMPARVLVLHAQCQAQMWRRNGFSLANQIFNYTAPLCRSEMFDRDLQMLQVCAARMAPNEFITRFADRFGLSKWCLPGFEDLPISSSTEGTPATASTSTDDLSKIVVTLAEEFLCHLIYILGERYVTGIGKCNANQRLDREIIHLLCTGEKTYSFIEKTVSLEPLMKGIERDESIQRVADFHKPASTTAGTFKLKPTLLDQYNVFFYHYSKQQYSQAEQHQWRLREKAARNIQACPPPSTPAFEPFFEPITHLFTSSSLITIIENTLIRFKKRSRFSSDALLHRALFLLCMGLNEEVLQLKENPTTSFKFSELTRKKGILDHLKSLELKSDADLFKHLIWWIIKKYDEIHDITTNSRRDIINDQCEKLADISVEEKAARRSALAAKKREQAMKRMQKMQKAFTTLNKDAVAAEAESNAKGNMTMDMDEDMDYAVLSPNAGFPVCLGPNKSPVALCTYRLIKCILCQEDEQLGYTGKPIVCCGFLQDSKLFANPKTKMAEALVDPSDVFAPVDLSTGYHMSTCSHTMHYHCYKQFSSALWNRDRNRPRGQMMGQHIIDIEGHEFLCPLCKRLSNCALPLLPAIDSLSGVKKFSACRSSTLESFDEWIGRFADLMIQPCQKSKEVKSHSRKRSHSERSLQELQKTAFESSINTAYSSSQPSVDGSSPFSSPGSVLSSSGAAVATSRQSSEPASSEHSAVHNAAVRTAECLMRMFQGKTSFFSAKFEQLTAVIKELMSAVYDLGPSMKQSKDYFEAMRFFKMTAFVLRSIVITLKDENKPLFGAQNTRQRDCIQSLARLCAIMPLMSTSHASRLTVARALMPFILTLEEQEEISVAEVKPEVEQQLNPILRAIRSPIMLLAGEDAASADDSSPSRRDSVKSKFSMFSKSTEDILTKNLRKKVNILDIDMLTVAVELTMTIGWTWTDSAERVLHCPSRVSDIPKVADGSLDELYSIYLCLLGYIFQNIAGYVAVDGPLDDVEMTDANLSEDSQNSQDRLRHLLSIMSRKNAVYGNICVPALEQHLRAAVVEFLQPLALLYNGITLIPPPDALKHTSYNEFDVLCRYLGLPNKLDDILASHSVAALFERWSGCLIAGNNRATPTRHPIKPRKLKPLPEEFTDLITMNASFRCPALKSDDLSTTHPTMCLVCGELMCSQSYCCQQTVDNEGVGACNFHMKQCCGKSGMFLRIRDCQVIMLTSRRRGCYRSAPYVDQFGETDTGFRRGNPLHLHPEMFRRLQRIWLHQEVAEEVINQYDMNHRNLNFDWHHF